MSWQHGQQVNQVLQQPCWAQAPAPVQAKPPPGWAEHTQPSALAAKPCLPDLQSPGVMSSTYHQTLDKRARFCKREDIGKAGGFAEGELLKHQRCCSESSALQPPNEASANGSQCGTKVLSLEGLVTCLSASTTARWSIAAAEQVLSAHRHPQPLHLACTHLFLACCLLGSSACSHLISQTRYPLPAVRPVLDRRCI
jgi:hypothetical protein